MNEALAALEKEFSAASYSSTGRSVHPAGEASTGDAPYPSGGGRLALISVFEIAA